MPKNIKFKNMKNLEMYGVQEMGAKELVSNSGGTELGYILGYGLTVTVQEVGKAFEEVGKAFVTAWNTIF